MLLYLSHRDLKHLKLDSFVAVTLITTVFFFGYFLFVVVVVLLLFFGGWGAWVAFCTLLQILYMFCFGTESATLPCIIN